MKILGSYKIKVGSHIFGGDNVLLWSGVLSGLQQGGSKSWGVVFVRDVEQRHITKNSYLEYSDFAVLPTGTLSLVSRSVGSHSMRLVFEGYPGEMADVDGVVISNEDSVALSAYKFRDRISLEDNVKVSILWRVEVRGV